MTQAKASPSTEPHPAGAEPSAPVENTSELSQEDLAGLNGGTFVDDLIKAIQNR